MKDRSQNIQVWLQGLLIACLLAGCASRQAGDTASTAPTNSAVSKHRAVTGSHIPIDTRQSGRVYSASTDQVRTYSNQEMQQAGYSSVSEFLNKRGTLR